MDETRVRIEVESCQPDVVSGRFRVVFRVHNEEPHKLQLQDAWLPHGRFRGDGGHVPLSEAIAAGGSADLEFLVRAGEPPGTIVENAYLVLRADKWRIFTRMRIEFDASARPTPCVETVTIQSLQ